MTSTGDLAGASPMTPAPHGPRPSYLPSQRHTNVVGLGSSSLLDVGILKSTILPSLGLNSGLSVAAYLAGRATDRLETKDWLWPSGMVLNAWWAAVGRRVLVDGVAAEKAWGALGRPEKLLLAGLSVWGGRLLWRIAGRSVRRGHDEPRYGAAKKEPGFWGYKAFPAVYLPEALFQTAITLPFSLLFRSSLVERIFSSWGGTEAPRWLSAVAVGLFGAGFALETLADVQLDRFKARSVGTETEMCREGVWSFVRHPNYLGDALVHFSFPLYMYANNLLTHPLALLGPVANYLFLRYVGGDQENEASQEQRYTKENQTKKVAFQRYQQEVNSFWPGFSMVANRWTWIVVGCGVAGAALERAMR